jgi:AcrR family transcriptional regulator
MSVRAGAEPPWTPPPRGTRPRNRRDLIRSAAAALFSEKGYAQVSIADIADSVNVAPSALYRHFSGKTEILYDVVDSALNTFADIASEVRSADLDDVAQALAEVALASRTTMVLWQRDSRHLPAAQRAVLRRRVVETHETLADLIVARRPAIERDHAELLSSSAIAVLGSVSLHHLQLPSRQFEQLLSELTRRVLFHEPATHRQAVPHASRTRRGTQSRRDELIDASAHLFARNGFATVSIDDIGAAVGIAGPSVYKHFDSKQELLLAAMHRGYEALLQSLLNANDESRNDEEALRRATDGYIDLALDHSDMITTLIVEGPELDEENQLVMRLAQRSYISELVTLVRAIRPDEDAIVARIKVQAALMVANDIGRTPRLRKVPGLRQAVSDVCWELQQ